VLNEWRLLGYPEEVDDFIQVRANYRPSLAEAPLNGEFNEKEHERRLRGWRQELRARGA
jgi:hypothetical protein